MARSAGSGKSAASRAHRAFSRPPESPKVPRALCLTLCPQAPTPTTAGRTRPQLCRFQNVTQTESDVRLLMYRERLSTSKNIHLSDGFKRIHSFFFSEYISTCSNNILEFPLSFSISNTSSVATSHAHLCTPVHADKTRRVETRGRRGAAHTLKGGAEGQAAGSSVPITDSTHVRAVRGAEFES